MTAGGSHGLKGGGRVFLPPASLREKKTPKRGRRGRMDGGWNKIHAKESRFGVILTSSC